MTGNKDIAIQDPILFCPSKFGSFKQQHPKIAAVVDGELRYNTFLIEFLDRNCIAAERLFF